MLKSWSIQNFKPIVDSGELKLAPVTVLAGRNSSGKSSLIQSILMIAQTLSNQVLDRPLLPNERIVQLGTFEDILNVNTSLRSLKISFGLEVEEEELDHPARYEVDPEWPYVKYIKAVANFISAHDSAEVSSSVEASKIVVENVLLKIDCVETKLFEDANENFALENFDYMFDFYISKPSSFSEYHLGEARTRDGEVRKEYFVALSHFLPVRLFSKEDMSHEYLESLNKAVDYITRFFTSKIRYLGPLRPDPGTTQRWFAPTSELDEVGAKGEYSVVVYHTNQHATMEWYNPQTMQTESGTLQDALDTWLRYLGIAYQIRTEVAGLMGVTWKITLKEGQKPRTLPEVGGGVNHILPILMMGLLAPSNTFLIIEEPEVTLHPSVQARLGDFFVGLSKCNKQCLIETHSENLISQLRYHIVQSGGQDKSDCIIYFVDQDEKGATRFDPVQISPQGNILNWPDGFFDETMLQEDRITAASIKRRAKLAKND